MIRARVRLFGGEVVPDVFDLCFKKVHEAVAVIRGGSSGGGAAGLEHLMYCREKVPGISMARVNESGVVRCPGRSQSRGIYFLVFSEGWIWFPTQVMLRLLGHAKAASLPVPWQCSEGPLFPTARCSEIVSTAT